MTVDADRELLELALRQLLDNAREVLAGDIGDRDWRERQRGRGDHGAELRTGDSRARTGAGIRARSIGARRRARFPAPGWGLRSCRQIAQAHGGTLTVSSTTEAGTTLTLLLPHGGPLR